MTDPLFEPLTFSGLTFPNRIVLAPMGTGLDDHGRMNDAAIAYYRRRAEGGAGAVTVEALLVDPLTEGAEPHAWDESYLPGLRRLATEIQGAGALAGAQLLHPGRQVLTGRRVGPSPLALNSAAPVPEELDVAGIAAIVAMFADSAELVARAGYDYVEIHGAHGYLISDFFSPLANHRTDAYGGDLSGRARLGREVVRAIVHRCPGLPVFFRLTADEWLPGGISPDDAVALARWLEQDGAACLSVSAGHWRSLHATIAPMWMPRAHLVEVSARIREAVSIPVIAVGRLDDPAAARDALTGGAADLVAIGRGLIADPDLPVKLAAGDDDRVRPCIACNACVELVGPGAGVRCAVNPAVGRDESWSVTPAAVPLDVDVVGSGPAGLEAARIAAERGHRVTLLERNDRIGGKLEVAASAPGKSEVLRFRDWEARELARLGVTVRVGVDVTPAVLAARHADRVVVATGAVTLRPPIPGIELPFVRDAQDYLHEHLRGDPPAPAGTRVVVIGGSATGCETAEVLAAQGASVTVVEMAASVGKGVEAITRRRLVKELRSLGVELVTGATVTAVEPARVRYTAAGHEHVLECDTVALAVGWRPTGADLTGPSAGPSAGEQRTREVVVPHVAGDALSPADFVAAVNAGADAGLAV